MRKHATARRRRSDHAPASPASPGVEFGEVDPEVQRRLTTSPRQHALARQRRRRWRRAVLAVGAVAAVAAIAVLPLAQASAPVLNAALTVFIGSISVRHDARPAAAHTGQAVFDGDAVRAAAGSRAGLRFPDGSVVRVDSGTAIDPVRVRPAAGGLGIHFRQLSGATWNSVHQALGKGSYSVDAPNGSTAEARGTAFTVVITTAADGSPVVTYSAFSGSVVVSAAGRRVIIASGQETVVGAGLPPTPPAPIGAGEQRADFTVFNRTVDAAPGAYRDFRGGGLSTGESTGVIAGAGGNGTDELDFTLGWPGSTFQLEVIDPGGAVYAGRSSPASPVTIAVPHAARGTWSYRVTDIESQPNEPWYVVVSVTAAAPPPSPSITFADTACVHQAAPATTDSWSVRASSPAGTPALVAAGLPTWGSFVDNRDGTGTFTFEIPEGLTESPPDFSVTASVGSLTASIRCTEELTTDESLVIPTPEPTSPDGETPGHSNHVIGTDNGAGNGGLAPGLQPGGGASGGGPPAAKPAPTPPPRAPAPAPTRR